MVFFLVTNVNCLLHGYVSFKSAVFSDQLIYTEEKTSLLFVFKMIQAIVGPVNMIT